MSSSHGGNSRHVLFVDDEDALGEAIGLLESGTEIALDTEFLPERRRSPELCLIQIATPIATILVDALAIRDLTPLVRALGAMDWVVHGARSDLKIFRDLGMQHTGRIWDVQIVHGLTRAAYPLRLDALASDTIGGSVSKDMTLSDWSARPLSRKQRRYAAEDVDHLLQIAKAQRKGRSGAECVALADICAQELARMIHEPPPSDTWHEVPGSHLLDARGVAVLRALLAWREEEAAIRGLPLHFVLGNPLLFYLSRHRPVQKSDLEGNRRFPRPVMRQHGEKLLQIIGEVMRVPETDLPATAPHDGRFLSRSSYLTAWATGYALARNIHPELLLPKALNSAIARGEPVSAVLTGWRGDKFGEALEQALNGQSSLRFGDDAIALEAGQA